MKIVILSALGNEVASRCISSLLRTSSVDGDDIYLVRERGFREQTLNAALQLVGKADDVLFVGDDIEFTPGWYEALTHNYDRGDILGMSMLYPNSTKVQDRGYDLLEIDEHISIEGKDRGRTRTEVAPFGVRYCDAVCGCFMFVKSNVLQLVSQFREEGQNRFGEFIFMCEARKHGASMAVIDHFLYHSGVSTKSNPNKRLSSMSYSFEKEIWNGIVTRYVDEEAIQIRIRRELSNQLRTKLENEKGQILIYGIGTVTEFLLEQVNLDDRRVSFCTGLPEEAGLHYLRTKVQLVTEVDFKDLSLVLITPLYIGEKIYLETLVPLLPRNYEAQIFIVESKRSNNQLIYDLREMS